MQNLREKLQRFMIGRYGADQLGRFLSWVVVLLALFRCFIRSYWILSFIRGLLLLLLIILYARIISRDISRRSRENEAYLRFRFHITEIWKKWRFRLSESRRYRIFCCPNCKQKIRIPRNHGKVSIHCPKCGNDFIKNTGAKK